MKFLRQNLPILLVALFEFAVGIMLLIKGHGEALRQTMFIVVGVVIALVSIVYFLRFFKEKKNGDINIFTISVAIILVVLGLLCAIFYKTISADPLVVAIIFGGVLIVAGIFKIQSFVDSKKTGIPLSFITLISAALSAISGIVSLINPFSVKDDNLKSIDNLMIFVGIILIVVAAIDVVSVFYNPNKNSKAVVPVEEKKEEKKEEK